MFTKFQKKNNIEIFNVVFIYASERVYELLKRIQTISFTFFCLRRLPFNANKRWWKYNIFMRFCCYFDTNDFYGAAFLPPKILRQHLSIVWKKRAQNSFLAFRFCTEPLIIVNDRIAIINPYAIGNYIEWIRLIWGGERYWRDLGYWSSNQFQQIRISSIYVVVCKLVS